MPARSSKRSRATVEPQPKADRPFAPGYGIVGPEDGKGLLPWGWVAGKMNPCRTFWLATIHPDHGRPHVMPVWGVWLDDAFFFSTGRKSRKGQNLAANAACTVTNDDGMEAVIVEGDAKQVDAAATLERIASAYQAIRIGRRMPGPWIAALFQAAFTGFAFGAIFPFQE